MKALRFNGKTFAPLGANAAIECDGFYERNGRRGVHLYKSDDKVTLEAYIVSNAQQGHFVVSASMTEEGPRYMFSTCSLTEKWLGTESLGLMAKDEAVRAIGYVDLQEVQAAAEIEQISDVEADGDQTNARMRA